MSVDRNFAVLDILNENMKKVTSLCKTYDKDMPTEMKLIYDAKNDKFQASHKYELVYTHDDVKMADHIADEWFEEVKSNRL